VIVRVYNVKIRREHPQIDQKRLIVCLSLHHLRMQLKQASRQDALDLSLILQQGHLDHELSHVVVEAAQHLKCKLGTGSHVPYEEVLALLTRLLDLPGELIRTDLLPVYRILIRRDAGILALNRRHCLLLEAELAR